MLCVASIRNKSRLPHQKTRNSKAAHVAHHSQGHTCRGYAEVTVTIVDSPGDCSIYQLPIFGAWQCVTVDMQRMFATMHFVPKSSYCCRMPLLDGMMGSRCLSKDTNFKMTSDC